MTSLFNQARGARRRARTAPLPLHAAVAFATVLLLAFALRWPPSAPWRPLPLRATALGWLAIELLWVPLLIGYLLAARALGLPVEPQAALQTVATQGASTEAIAVAAGAVLLAPLGEELLFRGYLLGSLLPVLPRQLANVLTAIAFGLMHGRDFALPATALGLCFGWLRLRHQSLLPSMLAHALHNALVVGVTFAWPVTFHWLYPS